MWFDPFVVAGEPPARAAETGLYLVGDKKDVIRLA